MPAWVLAAPSVLAAAPCHLPCNGDEPEGRCRACDHGKHNNSTLGNWEASWLGAGGKVLKVLSNSDGAKTIQAEKPGYASLEKIWFPKPLQSAAWPCSAAATFSPRVLPRTLKRPVSMCVSQAVVSHLIELCKEIQPSSKDGYSQQCKGPVFPCKFHTPQKLRTEEVFAGTSRQ